jgi:hypothetical protein
MVKIPPAHEVILTIWIVYTETGSLFPLQGGKFLYPEGNKWYIIRRQARRRPYVSITASVISY